MGEGTWQLRSPGRGNINHGRAAMSSVQYEGGSCGHLGSQRHSCGSWGKTQQRLGLWAGLSKGLGFRERPRAEKWSEVFVQPARARPYKQSRQPPRR